MSDAPVRMTMSPTIVVAVLHREDCGEDSDCAVCVIRRGKARSKESRKHAGLTCRCQISRPVTRGFQRAPDFPCLVTRLPRLPDPQDHLKPWLTAQELAIVHACL